jgi:hypothetical protein
MHLIWEWWGAMYGNVFAISAWTVVLFIWHHLSLKRHISAEHEKSRVHLELHVTGHSPGNDLPSEQEVP